MMLFLFQKKTVAITPPNNSQINQQQPIKESSSQVAVTTTTVTTGKQNGHSKEIPTESAQQDENHDGENGDKRKKSK